mmetsp:Transcript_16141/g.13697  ORF Transcript_16141/g.13697 Transcript_16141/m.13697 type:complete len:130 (+) Transcript_16141:59-448(+)
MRNKYLIFCLFASIALVRAGVYEEVAIAQGVRLGLPNFDISGSYDGGYAVAWANEPDPGNPGTAFNEILASVYTYEGLISTEAISVKAASGIHLQEPSVKGFDDAEYLVVGFMNEDVTGFVHGRDFGSG